MLFLNRKKIRFFCIALTVIFSSSTLGAELKGKVNKAVKPSAGDVNNKAADGMTIVSSCDFNANPQGFKISLSLIESTNGAQFTGISVGKIPHSFYADSTRGLPVLGYKNGDEPTAQPLGMQDTQNGKALNGGIARRNDGTYIVGDVYLIHNVPIGTQYTGESKGTQLPMGHDSATHNCGSQISHVINQLNTYTTGDSVPNINYSMAFNNTSGVSAVTGASSGDSSNWAANLYDSYYNATGQPGWSYSTVEYVYDLDNNVVITTNGNSYKISDTYIQALNNLRANMAAARVRQQQLEKVKAWFAGNDGFTFRLLEGSSIKPLELNMIEDEDAELFIPEGYGTAGYPSPQNVSGAGGKVFIPYPANLFLEAKHANYYLGANAQGGPTGAGPSYSHDPLPTSCRPDHVDFVTPAFLDAVVLEELRQDWRYLDDQNVAALAQKGFDFHQIYLNAHSQHCPSSQYANGKSSSEINEICDNMLKIYNPNLHYKTYNDGESTSPSNPVSKKVDSNSRKPTNQISKSSSYYQNLIENQLIYMNDDYSASVCMPKTSAQGIKKR